MPIVTLVRLMEFKNALVPMAVIGTPLIVLGMVTAPPWLLWPVTVIAPCPTM